MAIRQHEDTGQVLLEELNGGRVADRHDLCLRLHRQSSEKGHGSRDDALPGCCPVVFVLADLACAGKTDES